MVGRSQSLYELWGQCQTEETVTSQQDVPRCIGGHCSTCFDLLMMIKVEQLIGKLLRMARSRTASNCRDVVRRSFLMSYLGKAIFKLADYHAGPTQEIVSKIMFPRPRRKI